MFNQFGPKTPRITFTNVKNITDSMIASLAASKVNNSGGGTLTGIYYIAGDLIVEDMATIQNGYITNATIVNYTDVYIVNDSITNANIINESVINSTIFYANIDNAVIGNSFISNLDIVSETVNTSIIDNAMITNLNNTSSTITNLAANNIQSTNLDVMNEYIINSTIGNIYIYNATINNESVSNSYILGLTAVNSVITETQTVQYLQASLLNSSQSTLLYYSAIEGNVTNLVTTNVVGGLYSVQNEVAVNSSVTNMNLIVGTTVNQYVANIQALTATVNNLIVNNTTFANGNPVLSISSNPIPVMIGGQNTLVTGASGIFSQTVNYGYTYVNNPVVVANYVTHLQPGGLPSVLSIGTISNYYFTVEASLPNALTYSTNIFNWIAFA